MVSTKFCRYCVLALIFLAVAGMTGGCRSQRRATVTDTTGDALYSPCYPIESFYVPSCRLELSIGGQTFSLNGSIYIRPDSVFFFRGRMLIDVVRGAVYRDSFVVVNYLQRVYYTGKNDFLQRITGFPINPESLLLLFTADRCEQAYRDRFNFVITADGNRNDRIMMHDRNRNLVDMIINPNDQTIENIALYNSLQRQPLFSAVYGNYGQYEHFKLPTSINISAHDGTAPIQVRANFQEILLNQAQRVNISIPSSYNVVVLE